MSPQMQDRIEYLYAWCRIVVVGFAICAFVIGFIVARLKNLPVNSEAFASNMVLILSLFISQMTTSKPKEKKDDV